jgi:hypothetical protein
MAKTLLKDERSSGGMTMPDLNLYYRAIVIIIAWDWYSDRQVYKWNTIEDPETNPHAYGHLMFDKGAKAIQWKEDSIFNKWCWHNWWLACRRIHWHLKILVFHVITKTENPFTSRNTVFCQLPQHPLCFLPNIPSLSGTF